MSNFTIQERIKNNRALINTGLFTCQHDIKISDFNAKEKKEEKDFCFICFEEL